MKAKYRIGITEAGDAGLDFSWVNKMCMVDGAILISKDLNEKFRQETLRQKNRAIVHATVTGYGGTKLEPNVPEFHTQLANAKILVEQGFPLDHMVIRVDPIIPTQKGLRRAGKVLDCATEMGFRRFRVSILDTYPHVRERFQMAGLPLPYGDAFVPSKEQVEAVDSLLAEFLKRYPDACVEACAEKGLKTPVHCGCISSKDLALLGLEEDKGFHGCQRQGCMCYDGKFELLNNKHWCPHQCLYCYWEE